MLGKLDEYLRFNETALNLRAQRQQVLASNIANADTPNYKARDVDFASALQGALGRAGQAQAPAPAQAALAVTAPRHLATGAAATAAADGQLQYRTPAQGAVDGNTVDMDVERNQFADNALRYEAGITMINAQIREMMAAIQGAQ